MKRGSALLIVLGMMAFMVVSAVAFSMFMRQGRLPSSFLRQRITAAQLAKAALARAMQRIDAAVADNPYPGVGTRGLRRKTFKGNDGSKREIDYGNFWSHRVFLETEVAQQGALGGQDAELEFEPVATLPFEGLAYLPPPLVDVVRYWSRRTSTASWSSLGYDAGRYAFTAVNVSDYFDINRLRANVMRDSSAANRISLGYLFENGDHSGEGSFSPQKFDQFMQGVTNDSYRTRFVSMADYNLAIGFKTYGDCGFRSPFYEYVANGAGKSDGSFYNGDLDNARAQKFVTDSWYPGTNATMVLTKDEYQPLNGLGKGLDPLMKKAGAGFNEIKKHLNLAERAALVDYLDEDNVPTSLALPTAERVPMLTGLQLVPTGFAPKFVKAKEDWSEDTAEVDPDTGLKYKMVHRCWKLDTVGADAKLLVGGSAVFPFKRSSAAKFLANAPSSFNVQVLVKMYFAVGSHLDTRAQFAYRPANKNEWKKSGDVNVGLWSFVAQGSLSTKTVKSEDDALLVLSGVPAVELRPDFAGKSQFYGIKWKAKQSGEVVGDPLPDMSQQNIDSPLMVRDANGAAQPVTGLSQEQLADLTVNLLVWVRILDGDNTVDLVPATIADDQVYNGFSMPGVSTDALGEQQKAPVLPVPGPTLGFAAANFVPNRDNVDGAAGETKGLRIYCNDPRYNWAPEDWYSAGDEATISASDWLARVDQAGMLNGSDCRPHDILQFISNCGYLQSMGELQFLPQVRKQGDGQVADSAVSGSFFQGSGGRYNGRPFSQRTDPGQLVNAAYMWRQRWDFGRNADWGAGDDDDPYAWGILDTDGGMKVSPYADEDQLMAAFANTPYDWIAASEDNGMTLKDGRPYCFGPSSSEAGVQWAELQKMAQQFQSEAKAGMDAGSRWEDTYRDLNGWDQENNFFGADFGSDFHDVDRKYLFGYWRGCLDLTPQLYLIFVRAEPTVMGGSAAGHTPSQLGARAVALVWREGTSTINDTTQERGSTATRPHRMRILFYHQFE